MANAHRRRNYLDKVRVNGVMLLEEADSREGVANAFQCVLNWEIETKYQWIDFWKFGYRRLGHLEIHFLEEEEFLILGSRWEWVCLHGKLFGWGFLDIGLA